MSSEGVEAAKIWGLECVTAGMWTSDFQARIAKLNVVIRGQGSIDKKLASVQWN